MVTEKKVMMVNYVRGLADLNESVSTMLGRMADDITEHNIKPGDAVPAAYLTELQKSIESATNKVFSDLPLNDALKEVMDGVISHLMSKLTKKP